MILILSPAKTLDFESPPPRRSCAQPEFLDDAEELVNKLRRLSKQQLSALMGISDELTERNARRYRDWQRPFTKENARPAVLAFQGDVYQGLAAESFSKADLDFAQKHLRILSGLYGVLRPLDLMQPYRLEMGTKLSTRRGKDLYAFWGSRITESLNEALSGQAQNVLVNLASNEYFKAVRNTELDGRIVTPVFKEKKGDGYRVVAFFAKKARGRMAGFAIHNRITDPEDLKGFSEEGYRFHENLSSENEWVFTRDRS